LRVFLKFVKIHGDNFKNLRQKNNNNNTNAWHVTNFQSNWMEIVNGWATLKIFETLIECIAIFETSKVKLKMA
jgi:hypothetical protein